MSWSEVGALFVAKIIEHGLPSMLLVAVLGTIGWFLGKVVWPWLKNTVETNQKLAQQSIEERKAEREADALKLEEITTAHATMARELTTSIDSNTQATKAVARVCNAIVKDMREVKDLAEKATQRCP